MRNVEIAELKNDLFRHAEHVKAGSSPRMFERNGPVAQLVPLFRRDRRSPTDDDARLDRLERLGLICQEEGGLPDWFRRHRPARLRGGIAEGVPRRTLEGVVRSWDMSALVPLFVAEVAGRGIVAAEDGVPGFESVTFDHQQAEAAAREGFTVLGP